MACLIRIVRVGLGWVRVRLGWIRAGLGWVGVD